MGLTDIDQATERLRGVIGRDVHPDQMYYVCHDGVPASKARARFSRRSGRFYTPEKTKTEEEALAWAFKSALNGATINGPIAIIAIFFRPNFQRIDADNLMKLVMDAATKAGVWKDDCFVTAQASYMEFDPERPRTLIAFCDTESTLNRVGRFLCVACGERFDKAGTAAFKNPPKFCSWECRYGQIRQEKIHPGQGRGRKHQPPAPCADCGAVLSKRSYIRCRMCWLKARGRYIS